jgi:transcriptional regulator with XRE-family HTH domain
MAEKFGDYLKQRREQKHLTLRQVEEDTGIQNAYLSQLENGKIASPSPKYLHKLAGAYGVPYSMLLEMAGYPAIEKQDNSVKNLVSDEFMNLSGEEEDKLKEYLQFLRSTKKQG